MDETEEDNRALKRSKKSSLKLCNFLFFFFLQMSLQQFLCRIVIGF